MVTTLNELLTLSIQLGRVKLEWPQEVVGLFEVRANSVYFVNKILHTFDVLIAKNTVNHSVVSYRNAWLVNLTIATDIAKAAYGFQIGLTIGNIWLNQFKSVQGGFVALDENSVVYLAKSEKIKDCPGFWRKTFKTTETQNQQKFGFSGDYKLIFLLCLIGKSLLLLLVLSVLISILLSNFNGMIL